MKFLKIKVVEKTGCGNAYAMIKDEEFPRACARLPASLMAIR